MATNYKKAQHLMIDLETLDVTPTAVVLSVGACAFTFSKDSSPSIGATFSSSVEVLQQMLSGRSVSQDTLNWWTEQSPSAKDRVMHPKEIAEPETMLDNLDAWMVPQEFDYIWCQGGSFDFPILTNLYRSYDRDPAWKFWQERDSRTLIGMGDVDKGRVAKELELTQHDSLDDCFLQVHAMARVLF